MLATGGVVVLLSGGIDSTVCAAGALADRRLVGTVTVDYGQPVAAQERAAALMWSEQHGITCHIQTLELEHAERMGIGTNATGARVVPGRNAALLRLAADVASGVGAAEIWYGAIADDYADYEDCRADFIERMCAELAPIQVRAPLLAMTKRDVIAEAKRLGVNLSETWSCYQSRDDVPCGGCNSCVQRAAALL